MFSYDQTAGRVVCLADYGRLKAGAIVPVSNELYSDVEDWLDEGNTLAEFDGYPDTRPLEEVKEAKLKEINEAYNEQMRPLIKSYPEIEREGWGEQKAEAQAYQAWVDADSAGDPPATPTLDYILSGRNGDDGTETLAELVGKVLANVATFQASQELTGKRHRLEKAINGAATKVEVEAVAW
tara:strand:- start:30342 stop:30887 length:546 start_codon:yes stop_codon:yes gene_type:complete